MADNEEFLKKVYDRYLGSDYEWGDADLNPKREIKKSSEEDWEQEQAEIVSIIEARLKELQKQAAKLPKYKKSEIVDNDDFKTTTSGLNGGPSPSKDTSLSQIATQVALGGDVGDSLFIPSSNYDDQINFMINEIIPSLIPVLVQLPNVPSTTPNGLDLLQEMSNPGCDTENTYDDFETSNDELTKLKESFDEDDEDSENDDEYDGLTSSGATSVQAEKAADKADTLAEKAVAERNKQIAECIAKELGILQYILALLKVINMIKKVALLILSIIVPISKMISAASQCWINPPAANEVLQAVAEKLSALIMTIIGEVLQLIWKLLEMDCMTEQVQKVLDEINEVLSGVDSTINMTKNFVSFGMKQYETNKQSLVEAYNNFIEEDENGNKKIRGLDNVFNKDEWKKAGETFKDTFKEGLFGKDGLDESGLTTEGLKTFISAGIPSGMKDTLNNLIDSTKNVFSAAKDIFDETGSKDNVLKATLQDVVDFLGPINIK